MGEVDIPRTSGELTRMLECGVESSGQLDSAKAAGEACKALGDIGLNVGGRCTDQVFWVW